MAIVKGDSAGYDIRSFNLDGSDRHIEVKSTAGPASNAFYISPNEIAFSEKTLIRTSSCACTGTPTRPTVRTYTPCQGYLELFRSDAHGVPGEAPLHELTKAPDTTDAV